MSIKTRALAIHMLKTADTGMGVGRAIGKGLVATGKGLLGTARIAGNVGKGLAHGVGAPESVGQALGLAGLAGTGIAGYGMAKRKKDQWMYQHGFY